MNPHYKDPSGSLIMQTLTGILTTGKGPTFRPSSMRAKTKSVRTLINFVVIAKIRCYEWRFLPSKVANSTDDHIPQVQIIEKY